MSIVGMKLDKLLKRRAIIWLLLAVNIPGTIYGYIWYGNQLAYTAAHYPSWLLPFVPDSPTASLFFTLALILLLYPPKTMAGMAARALIEALAVVTSVKYGIWAVAIILAGGYQGGTIGWQDWMLISSHAGMAVEALLYARFFICRRMLPLALLWTLLNDTVDYSWGVYPWLPKALADDVPQVQTFTFLLTLISAAFAWLASAGINSRRPKLK
ncbi:putative membrane protein YpjA [Paenibacillus forsythiae]|uniref:Membrane protein YpjA n=1 Tax=Paenibacillus forsythiae TaxID=365616 RepID=A0ABU3H7I1_9BACL|nr:putative membrane protein YpjA [Paenibacillus forsythiae]